MCREKQHRYQTAGITITISGVFQLIFLLLILPSFSSGQVCDGNLGENIFEDGDFGRGSSNVLMTDPQIAPGYIYQTNPPPNDGYYTITNYTGNWNLFPGWMSIRDNSSDPLGYMMVVNASHAPGLFYEKEITGLCENTLYAFSADIINLIESDWNMIKPNVSFLIDGEIMYNTGFIPEDETWNTYGFTFTTDPGQTSITLSLRNNAQGGNGNDLALDNISFRACGPKALILPDEIANICEDGDPVRLDATLIGDAYESPSFQWQQSFDEGQTWENIDGETSDTYWHTNLSAGYYYYRFVVANGPVNIINYKCRVSSNPKVVYVIPKNHDITDSICRGLSYPVGDNGYDESGIYVDTLTNSIGCDSIVTLTLTVVDDPVMTAVYNAEDPSCSYTEDGRFLLEEMLSGKPPFSLIFDGEHHPIEEPVYGLRAGDYTYAVTDRYGCSMTETVTLISPEPFVIDLGSDTVVDLGDPVIIIPEANYEVESYTWEPDSIINCEGDCMELVWPPPQAMYIRAKGTSAKKCLANDSVFIAVNEVRRAWFPNAFSPNGDGLNDYYTVFGSIPNVKLVDKMIIFDRWGKKMFEAYDFVPNEPNAGWDGRADGKPQPPAVYVYVMFIRFLDDEVIRYSGSFTLVR